MCGTARAIFPYGPYCLLLCITIGLSEIYRPPLQSLIIKYECFETRAEVNSSNCENVAFRTDNFSNSSSSIFSLMGLRSASGQRLLISAPTAAWSKRRLLDLRSCTTTNMCRVALSVESREAKEFCL